VFETGADGGHDPAVQPSLLVLRVQTGHRLPHAFRVISTVLVLQQIRTLSPVKFIRGRPNCKSDAEAEVGDLLLDPVAVVHRAVVIRLHGQLRRQRQRLPPAVEHERPEAIRWAIQQRLGGAGWKAMPRSPRDASASTVMRSFCGSSQSPQTEVFDRVAAVGRPVAAAPVVALGLGNTHRAVPPMRQPWMFAWLRLDFGAIASPPIVALESADAVDADPRVGARLTQP
jgi:hypothetical protein